MSSELLQMGILIILLLFTFGFYILFNRIFHFILNFMIRIAKIPKINHVFRFVVEVYVPVGLCLAFFGLAGAFIFNYIWGFKGGVIL